MTALVVLVLDLARSGVQSISASSLFKKQMHLVCQPHEIDFSCEHFNLFLRTTHGENAHHSHHKTFASFTLIFQFANTTLIVV